MTLFRLIIKSIIHFRRQHLALFAGTLLSTAILTGALITGDSVKYSLKKMVDLRLGNTGFAMETGDRFVRSELTNDISAHLKVKTTAVLRNQGMANNPATDKRVNGIEVLGIDNDFWKLSDLSEPKINAGEAIVSENLAEKLQIQVDDELVLRMEQASLIPVNAPFAEDNTTTAAIRLKVGAIADNDHLGRFSLKSNQIAPYNIFVDRNFLAARLNLEGLANIILVEDKAGLDVEKVNQAFAENWNLKDAGLKLTNLTGEGHFELTSNRIFIDPVISDAIESLQMEGQPVLTYLVNSIHLGDKSTPYSFVTASTPPILSNKLGKQEIIINSWLADDLGAKINDTLLLDYFVIGPMRKLANQTKSFVIRDVIPLKDLPDARALMPDFLGMANAGSCTDWNTGVPIDLEKIRDKDEKYWDDYRGTPKAFISIEAGEEMWANQFGKYTAFRFSGSKISKSETEEKILSMLTSRDLGLQFRPVRNEGLDGVKNAVDFGELFLSLSFFVIAAGVLLTALLFSLHIASRNREGGVLAAIGFSRKQIVKFRMLEALLVIITGSIAGTFAGILYNMGIMHGLNSVWRDVVRTTSLWIYIDPATLFTGAISGIFIAFATIFIITRSKLKKPINALITKSEPQRLSSSKSKYFLNSTLIVLGLGSAFALVIFSLLNNVSQNSGLFLPAGGLFLVGLLALVYRLLAVAGNKFHDAPMSLWQLVLKNAGRNKTASLSTITLLALGTFTIIITGANQQTFYGASNNPSSGTGGFQFWAETSVPLIYDLNTPVGKEKYGLEDEPVLKDANFIQFHNLQGDDASCLNLNQVSQPQILGVDPKIFDQRGSFSFTNLMDNVDENHPWLSLNQEIEKGLIPAFADQTVITWGLMLKVGDTLTYINEQGNEIKLLLAGGLKNSIFQGNILIADSIFLSNYPSTSGSEITLIDTPAPSEKEIADLLEYRLMDYGIELMPTTTRLATFNSVTNTYLSVFMILGGLGVLIGTIGLGIVLLRNIQERKSELTLLSALGFQKSRILCLVFFENFVLLLAGIIAGILSALVGILPTLLSPSFEMNTLFVSLLVAAVFASGLLWIYFPARQSLKKFSIRELQEE